MLRALPFALVLGCTGPTDDATDAPPSEDCPTLLVDDIDACVDDWLADPDNTLTEAELVEACADAEPLADAWDAYCAAADPRPPLCDASYELAWTEVRDGCAAEAAAERGIE